MPEAQHLMTVPGIGTLTATALVAFVGDVGRFGSCRSFADYLGLTPREHSSGSVRRLGRITKRGNSYLRMLLIHGARSALRAGMTTDEPDDLRAWALKAIREIELGVCGRERGYSEGGLSAGTDGCARASR